jgi:hypothetical protein
MPILVMVRLAVEEPFVRVTDWSELVTFACVLNVIWVGESVITPVPEELVPVPVSDTAAGIPLPLPLMVSVPVRAPVVVGAKATRIVQLEEVATDAQLLVTILKLLVIVTPLITRVCELSVFWTVTV